MEPSCGDLQSGLADLLSEFTVAVYKHKPVNLSRFAADYFTQLADEQGKRERKAAKAEAKLRLTSSLGEPCSSPEATSEFRDMSRTSPDKSRVLSGKPKVSPEKKHFSRNITSRTN